MSHMNVSWKHTKDVNCYDMLSYHEIGKFKGKQVENNRLTIHLINNLREAKESVAFLIPILLTCSVGDRVTLKTTLHSEV